MKPLITLITILPILVACSPTIDSTDERTFQRSVQRISDSLDKEQQSRLHSSMWALERDTASIVPGTTRTEEQELTALRDRLDGLTANEVIQMGEPLLKTYFDKRRKQLKELQAKKAAYEARVARKYELLALLSLRNPMWLREGEYSAILKIDVLNGLPYAVSSFNGTATLIAPGRDVPLSQNSIKYEFFGGIQPGESKNIVIKVSTFGWAQTILPANTRVDLKLESITARESNSPETIFIDRSGLDLDWVRIDEQELKELTEQFGEGP